VRMADCGVWSVKNPELSVDNGVLDVSVCVCVYVCMYVCVGVENGVWSMKSEVELMIERG